MRDDILSYEEIVQKEGMLLQKGMNFRVGKGYSILLMSVRKGAPYRDEFDQDTGLLIYEGHDVATKKTDPKSIDQPMSFPSGKLTENGNFTKRQKISKREQHLVSVCKCMRKSYGEYGVTKECLR